MDASNTPSWRKEYALRDHLGNTRLMFADKDGDGIVEVTSSAATNEILQELHYYPFGLSYGGTHWMNDAARDNGHKYNGKELNEDWGLGWYDYGARWYMPDLGRWGAVDPLAVKSRHISVYGYANNSPFMFIDPTGEENMIYLVFILNDKVRLSSSHINEIVRIAQRIMDKSGANVKISQVIRNAPYTEEELALRDETDRTVFISDYYTLRKHFPNLKPEPGEADPEMKLGGVDASFFLQGYAAPEGGDKRLEEYYEDQVGSLINGNVGDALAWIAKTAIHEAFHTLPGGPGHSNEQNALRYGSAGGGLSVPVAGDNLMMQHQTGSSLERFPRENRPLLFSFLWQDRRILHEYYNKQTPKDNFTERLKK